MRSAWTFYMWARDHKLVKFKTNRRWFRKQERLRRRMRQKGML